MSRYEAIELDDETTTMMSNDDQYDEKVTTPIPWGDDPFEGVGEGSKDGVLADLAPYMERNDATYVATGSDDLHEYSMSERDAVASGSLPSEQYAYSIENPSEILAGGVGVGGGSAGGTVTNKRSRSASRDDTPPASRRTKKPKGMPKRPLSAYNLYFQSERAKMMDDAEKGLCARIGFEGLGKIIGARWRALAASVKKGYEELAEKDSARYRREMDEYNRKKREAKKKIDDAKDAAAIAAVRAGDKFSIDGLLRAAQSYTVPLRGDPNQDQKASVPPGNSASISYSAVNVHEGRVSPPPSPKIVCGGGSSLAALNPASLQRLVDYNGPPDLQTHQHQEHQNRLHFNSAYEPHSMIQHPRHGRDMGMAECSPSPMHHPRPSKVLVPPPPSPSTGAVMLPIPSDHLPVPAGMEIILPDSKGRDHKYRIQYSCFSMTREAASKYVESVTGTPPTFTTPAAPPSTSVDVMQTMGTSHVGGSHASAFEMSPTRQPSNGG